MYVVVVVEVADVVVVVVGGCEVNVNIVFLNYNAMLMSKYFC